MRCRCVRVVPVAAVAALALGWAGAAAAQPAAGGADLLGRTVTSIAIDTPQEELRAEARAAIVLRPGDAYTLEAIRDSLQNLHALGTIAGVEVLARESTAGVALVFRIAPLLRLWDVTFAGTLPWKEGRLRRALSIREGQPLDEAVARRQAARLQQALADDGYLLAEVEAAVLEGDRVTRGVLRLHVEPGPLARLDALRLEGDYGMPQEQVLIALGLRQGEPFRPAVLEAALERLRARLLETHHFFHSVGVLEQSLDLQTGAAQVVLSIEAGPRVALTVAGIDRTEHELHDRLAIYEFGTVDDWALKESRQQLVTYLQERGHWRPLVSYSVRRDDEDRNVEVEFRILRGEKRGLKRIEFDGNSQVPDEVLGAAIRSRTGGFLSPGRFISQWWEQDQEAVVTAYRRRGFRQARVIGTRVAPAGGGLTARMTIDEGLRTTVAEHRIEVDTAYPAPGIDAAGWGARLEIRPGGPFDSSAVRRDADRLRALLGNAGYPRALIESEIIEGEGEGGVVVVQRIRPGERVRIDRVLITGNEAARTDVIRRELGFVPGSPLAFAELLETQSRLYRTGLFDEVDIAAAEPDAIEPARTMVVRVHESPPLFFSYGAGFDTEEKLRTSFAIGHDNLLGRGQEVTLSSRLSLREQRIRLLHREPRFLGRRLESSTVAFFTREEEESFDVQRFGGSFNLLLRGRGDLSFIWRYSFRDVQTSDILIDPQLIDREDRSTRVGALGAALIYDSRPDPIEPRAGSYQTLDVDIAHRVLGSDKSFATLFGRSFWYVSLGDRMVLALAARAGVQLPLGKTNDVPLPERFFVGGSTTLRGFPLDRGGPVDALGNPLGGEVLLVANAEARFRLWGDVGAVVFADWGNVFATPREVAIEEMREILGVGGRYATAVGPVRFDLAWLLDRRAGEDAVQVFVSVGHTF